MQFEGHGSEEDGVVGELVEVGEALDDGDAATEENFVDAGDFGEVGDVGYRGRFDAEDGDFFRDAPVGEVFGDARELEAVEVVVFNMSGPAGVEEEGFAGLEVEVGRFEEFFGLGVGKADDVGAGEAGFERGLVDVFFAFFITAEVVGGIHVGARVGVKVEGAGVPAVVFEGFGGLPVDAAHAGFVGEGEIDEH